MPSVADRTFHHRDLRIPVIPCEASIHCFAPRRGGPQTKAPFWRCRAGHFVHLGIQWCRHSAWLTSDAIPLLCRGVALIKCRKRSVPTILLVRPGPSGSGNRVTKTKRQSLRHQQHKRQSPCSYGGCSCFGIHTAHFPSYTPNRIPGNAVFTMISFREKKPGLRL